MGKSHDLATIATDGLPTLEVDTIKNTGGTTGLSINSDGVVTKNVLPAFSVGLTSDEARTSQTERAIYWNRTSGQMKFIQGGMSLDSSNGKITVPVAGVYAFHSNIRIDTATSSQWIIGKIVRNADTQDASEVYNIHDLPSSTYQSIMLSGSFLMNAGDFVQVYAATEGDTSWHIDDGSSMFSGHLIG